MCWARRHAADCRAEAALLQQLSCLAQGHHNLGEFVVIGLTTWCHSSRVGTECRDYFTSAEPLDTHLNTRQGNRTAPIGSGSNVFTTFDFEEWRHRLLQISSRRPHLTGSRRTQRQCHSCRQRHRRWTQQPYAARRSPHLPGPCTNYLRRRSPDSRRGCHVTFRSFQLVVR